MNLDEELTEAKAELSRAKTKYTAAEEKWEHLPLGTIERAEAEKAVTFAEKAKSEAQARVRELEALLIEEKKLAQGKFIVHSPFTLR
jgi:uncharacterized protein YceH (UPF0502 family)